jgi:hypothetical protein
LAGRVPVGDGVPDAGSDNRSEDVTDGQKSGNDEEGSEFAYTIESIRPECHC